MSREATLKSEIAFSHLTFLGRCVAPAALPSTSVQSIWVGSSFLSASRYSLWSVYSGVRVFNCSGDKFNSCSSVKVCMMMTRLWGIRRSNILCLIKK